MAHKPIKTLVQLFANVKDKSNSTTDLEQFTRSHAASARWSFAMTRPVGIWNHGWLNTNGRLKTMTSTTTLPNTICRRTKNKEDWDSTKFITQCTNYHQRPTRKAVYKLRTCFTEVLPTTIGKMQKCKWLIDETNRTVKQRQRFRAYTDRDAPITGFPTTSIKAENTDQLHHRNKNN